MTLQDLLDTLSEFQYLMLKPLGNTVYYLGNAHDVPSKYHESEVREIATEATGMIDGMPSRRVKMTIWIDPVEKGRDEK